MIGEMHFMMPTGSQPLAAARDSRPDWKAASTPGDWRLQMIFDHAVEVIGDESFPTREAAVEEIVDRLVNCPGEIRTERIQ
jgi:hypothetical protein